MGSCLCFKPKNSTKCRRSDNFKIETTESIPSSTHGCLAHRNLKCIVESVEVYGIGDDGFSNDFVQLNSQIAHRESIFGIQKLFKYLLFLFSLLLFSVVPCPHLLVLSRFPLKTSYSMALNAVLSVLVPSVDASSITDGYSPVTVQGSLDSENSSDVSQVLPSDVTFAKRRQFSGPTFGYREDLGEFSLIVLDSEGQAYKTDFSRNLFWVTRFTDNLLVVEKPYAGVHQICAPKNLSNSEVTHTTSHKCTFSGDNFKCDEFVNHRKSQYDHLFREKLNVDVRFRRHLVPSYDGYVYYVDELNNSRLLNVHVRDIVNFTPFRTPLLEGVYLEGSRHSSVLALDYETGDYITRDNSKNGVRSPRNGYLLNLFFTKKGVGERQLHVGYTEWRVKAFDEKYHTELWSFNWREVGCVNNESVDMVVLEKIREMVRVNGNKLTFCVPNDETLSSELRFPFPIAAIFAVFLDKNREIMTLQPLYRVSLPPPISLLQMRMPNPHTPLSLKNSRQIGQNLLSSYNCVIKALAPLESPNTGISYGTGIAEDAKLRELPGQSNSGNGITDTLDETAIFLLKWWWLLILWLLAILLTPLVWIYRRVRKRVHKGFDQIGDISKSNFSDKIEEITVEEIKKIHEDSSEFSSDSAFSGNSAISIDRNYSGGINWSNDDKVLRTELRRAKSEGNLFLDAPVEEFEESVWLEERSIVGVFGAIKKFSGSNLPTVQNFPSPHEGPSVSKNSLSIIPSDSPLTRFLENGRFLRTFECIKLLGKGGFGSVYRAQHRLEPGNPIYAVKFVLLQLKSSEDLSSKRYFREVAANRDIYSKYVVRYYTWWCEEPHFLPLAKMTPELRSAARINVHRLINVGAISPNCSKIMDGYPHQYHDIVREFTQKTTVDEVFPSFSKIAQNSQKKTSLIPRLLFRRNDRKALPAEGKEGWNDPKYLEDFDSRVDSRFRNFVSQARNENLTDLSGCIYPSEGSYIDFKRSMENPNTSCTTNCDKPGQFNRIIDNAHSKDPDKQYPVVLLILMEMCNGFTLREWLNRPERSDRPLEYINGHKGLPIEFELFRQLIKGLRDIHDNCFIHRDLKPENIFVEPKTNALKIGDLGLVGFIEENSRELNVNPTISAKAHLLSDATQVSVRGQLIGTPGYTAPEGGGNCTEKADIYSAALILLELLCPRFNTTMERLETLERFRSNHEVPKFIKDTLKPWYQLMVRMADPIPDNRPSALEVHRNLKSILDVWKASTSTTNNT